MKFTTTRETEMTATQMIQQAEKLESDADTLYLSLLAPSMAEKAMREDAKALREQAAK